MSLERKCWIRENGSGQYCEGYFWETEVNIIFVTQKPIDSFYNWNIETSVWETTLDLKRQWIRPTRDQEISRTDKYLLSDLWTKFANNEQSQIVTYRQELRDCPEKETIEEIIMPNCPDCIKE